jgi:glycosyltransferase involved in cell wall biosynthesis
MTADRVLMSADTLGGVWNYALDLGRALPETHFTIATMGRRLSPPQRRQAAALANVTIRESEFRLEWMDEPWRDVDAAGKWLLEIAREIRPDVIHLNGYSHAVLDWPAPAIVVAHSCVLSWWRAVKRADAPQPYSEYRRRVAAGLNAASVIVAPTAAMLDSLGENYRIERRGRIVPNGRDPSQFKTGEKSGQIISAGRIWDDAKNMLLLNTIARRVRWPIVVAGDERHPNGSRAVLLNVASLGVLSARDLQQQLARSAIYAAPARYEPFGLAVLEAALSSCALVLSDIATFREIWRDAALFVPPDDGDAWVSAINSLIDHDARREEMGLRARARALEFDLERMGNGYRAVYESVSQSKAAPA